MRQLRLKLQPCTLARNLPGNRIELIRLSLALIIVLFLFSSAATGKEFHPLKDIEKSAEEFLRQHLSSISSDGFDIRINPLDHRLKLKFCSAPLEAYLPAGAKLHGKTTVGIRCNGSKPWKVFVPVNLVVYENVLAAKRHILRGEVIKAADLIMTKNEITVTSRNNFHNFEKAAGLIAKRSIPAGKIITTNVVRAPRLVQRGQEVILLATTPQLEVRMKGKALSDGSKGDIIQVRNLKSKRIVEGVVTHLGIVKVRM